MSVTESASGVLPRLLVGGALVASSAALLPLVRHLAQRLGPRARAGHAAAGQPTALGGSGATGGSGAASADGAAGARAPWTASDLGAVLAAAIGLALAFSAVLGRLGPVPLLVQLSGSIATLAGAVVLAALLARRAGVGVRAAFAAELDGLPRAAGAGIACYLLLLPGLMGCALLWPAVLEALGLELFEQTVVRAMRALDPGQRPLALLLGVVLGPLFEELFFRGFLQRTLARTLPGWAAVALSSLAFSALHGVAAFLPVFALSLILGGVLQSTRRVGAAWAVHALFNAQTFALLWAFPELGRAFEGSPPGLCCG